MNELSSHHFQFAADFSSDIVFRSDIFDYDVTTGNTRIESEAQSRSSSMIEEQRREVIHDEVSKIATSKTTSLRIETIRDNRHVTFQDSRVKRRLSSIHSAFRRRSIFDKTNDVAALNDQIARNEEITFTYEQLSHRLQISKQNRSASSAKCVIELTRTNNYLLQELTYHKDTRAADMKFHETVADLHVKLNDALKERSQKRADAESTLLSYWDIDFDDENVENTVF